MTYQYKREPLRPDEELRLRGSARTPREKLAIILSLETGIRVSELAELQLDHVDWQSRRIIVYGKGGDSGHNSKRRVLPLSDEAFEILAASMHLLEDDNRRTTAEGTNVWITTRTLNRIVKRCANRARITRPASPHVLRHTFAVDCLRQGIDVQTLMKLLGHEKLQTTQGYLNLSPEDVCNEFRRKWRKKRSEE
jgi:integrase/recombinase XerD